MDRENTIVVGAGPIGLACAISAKRRGLDPLVIDAGAIVNSIAHYPVGMGFFTTPDLLEIGSHPLVCASEKPTREEALKYYRGVVRSEGLRVRTYTRLAAAERVGDGIMCQLAPTLERGGPDDADLRYGVLAQRVVLATGYYDNPNPLGVPGEDLPHVHHYFGEAHTSCGLDVVVIGGKNSAVEAALLLYRAGARTTLVYRGDRFSDSVKYWLKPDIENRVKAGEIRALLGAEVLRIEPRDVCVRLNNGNDEQVAADRVYALTGYHPDFELFRRIGIELDPETCVPTIDRDTLETNVAGVYMAGSISAGHRISNVFIENGRFDGEKIFRT
jgi:thioredoxin reductase (NADPH)